MVVLEAKDITELANMCINRMVNVECPTLMSVMVDVIVRAQKEVGFNINTVDGYGLTPLMNAASEGFGGLVRRLMDAGADPFIQEGNGQTALSFAKAHGKISEPHREIAAFLEAVANPVEIGIIRAQANGEESRTGLFQLAATSPSPLQMG